MLHIGSRDYTGSLDTGTLHMNTQNLKILVENGFLTPPFSTSKNVDLPILATIMVNAASFGLASAYH